MDLTHTGTNKRRRTCIHTHTGWYTHSGLILVLVWAPRSRPTWWSRALQFNATNFPHLEGAGSGRSSSKCWDLGPAISSFKVWVGREVYSLFQFANWKIFTCSLSRAKWREMPSGGYQVIGNLVLNSMSYWHFNRIGLWNTWLDGDRTTVARFIVPHKLRKLHDPPHAIALPLCEYTTHNAYSKDKPPAQLTLRINYRSTPPIGQWRISLVKAKYKHKLCSGPKRRIKTLWRTGEKTSGAEGYVSENICTYGWVKMHSQPWRNLV